MTLSVELAVDGPAAPPRANGELVFSAPWESRAFGMAMALYDAGAFGWEEFQQALIARISAWEAAPPAGQEYSYYTHWQGALEDVLVAKGTLGESAVGERAVELSQRPAGYDHDHGDDDHGHGHGHGHGH